MNADLQEKLARRRRMAEGGTPPHPGANAEALTEDIKSPPPPPQRSPTSPVKQELKGVGMSSEMKAIMDQRRRKIQDHEGHTPPSSPPLEILPQKGRRSSLDTSIASRESRKSIGSAGSHPRNDASESRRKSREDASVAESSVESSSANRSASVAHHKRRKSRDGELEFSLGSLEERTARRPDSDDRSRASTRSAARPSRKSSLASRSSADDSTTEGRQRSRREHLKRSASTKSLDSQESSESSGLNKLKRSSQKKSMSTREIASSDSRESMKKTKSHSSFASQDRSLSPKKLSRSRVSSSHSLSSGGESVDSSSDKARRGKRRDSGHTVKSTRSDLSESGMAKEFLERKTRSSVPESPGAASTPRESTGFDSGFPSDFAGFSPTPSQGETAFGQFPNSEEAGFGADAFSSKSFPAFDSSFDPKGSPRFSSLDTGFEAFDKPMFSSNLFSPAGPEQPLWDTDPLQNPPVRPSETLEIDFTPSYLRNFVGEPVTNPVNENVLFCESTRDGFYLREIDTTRQNVVVSSVEVLSLDVRKKVLAKYSVSAYAVGSVKKIVVGAHKIRGELRVRVAAYVDILVLESASPVPLIVVWQWGYGATESVAVHQVMSPPKEAHYDPQSLAIADNLLFLSGRFENLPCIFIRVNDVWRSCFLPGMGGNIAFLSVNPTRLRGAPLILVFSEEKSLSLWTYADVLTTKASESQKILLTPVYRLDAPKTLSSVSQESLSSNDGGGGFAVLTLCGVDWYSPSSRDSSSVLLLAVVFSNALCLYHVSPPGIFDPTEEKVLSSFQLVPQSDIHQTQVILPFTVKQWSGKQGLTSARWIDIGPASHPCVGILSRSMSKDSAVSSLSIGMVAIPYRKNYLVAKESLLPLRIFAEKTWPSTTGGRLCFVGPNGVSGQRIFDSDGMFGISFSSNLSLDPLYSYKTSISTCPSGLDSFGMPLPVDTIDDSEGVLHVYSVLHSEQTMGKENVLVWGLLSKRIFLCMTLVADCKASGFKNSKARRGDSGFGADEETFGGAVTSVIAELDDESLSGLVPSRIVRSPGSKLCAILFRSSPCSKSFKSLGPSTEPSLICVVDYSVSDPLIRVIKGRDMVFWPQEMDENPSGLLLATDGSALIHFRWIHGDLVFGTSYRPFLGVDADDNFIECRRIYCITGASKLTLLAVGLKHKSMRTCIVGGELCDLKSISPENWAVLLPNAAKDHSIWFKEGETIENIVGLQCDDNGYRNFAVTSSSRVLILSSALTVITSSEEKEHSPNLAPVGSFVAVFSTRTSLRYLSCLDGDFSSGVISSYSSGRGNSGFSILLLSLRQDRVIYNEFCSGLNFSEYRKPINFVQVPIPVSKPALMLEALIANAISIGGKGKESTSVLRVVVERFGRFLTSLSHADDEGIGSYGIGLTPRVFSMLSFYSLTEAASWLLTGTVRASRSSNTRILPHWIPIEPKTGACRNLDMLLPLVSEGDQYLAQYIKAPKNQLPSNLPRINDPACRVVSDKVTGALSACNPTLAITALDFVGSAQFSTTMFQVGLLHSRGSKPTGYDVLRGIAGNGERELGDKVTPNTLDSLVSLALEMKGLTESRRTSDVKYRTSLSRSLAPSFQRSVNVKRERQEIFEYSLLSFGEEKNDPEDRFWTEPCIEAKHVWNEGPKREKDKLMKLNSLEDWFGKSRPLVIGKAGVSAASDRGGTQLADLIYNDNESFGDDEALEGENDGWIDGVGEGRTDEANLCGYFRMSEGEDADSSWRLEGLSDITHYQNTAKIIGNTEAFSLEPSTSSVDEGEAGKVKALFDLVFHQSGFNKASGLVIPCTRGSSLDVGALHSSSFRSRQKCTLEFWFFVPDVSLPNELILARRTIGSYGDDFSKCALAQNTGSVLWEIVLSSTGKYEIRTGRGQKLSSEDVSATKDQCQVGKWNHLCLVLSPGDTEGTCSEVKLFNKGDLVTSGTLHWLPDNGEKDHSLMNELTQKSHLYFGLNHPPGFRMTELRVWACQREEDDINAFMFECLSAAEAKKKFTVKIKKGGKGGLLAPGKPGSLGIGRTTSGGLKVLRNETKGFSISLAPKVSLAPVEESPSASPVVAKVDEEAPETYPEAFEASFPGFGEPTPGSTDILTKEQGPMSLWDSALPLSAQVRASAASAIIRGPPATRHFGGNRGGLPDFQGVERFGVGGIAICGSEKTIVWRDNEDPPALTYPIGASGAIVSDQMDDEGSEFLCSFLAKEKRMVVFELQSRTVVVELQMTTKLNFWRFLPPEACQNTLCFLLITPVGGFHWMPLEDSPRPQQVWKRGPELQGKKVVNYEEGGSNGLDDSALSSRVGLVMVTESSGEGLLEAWILPISGNSGAIPVSEDVLGACFCIPTDASEGSFLPLLLTVHKVDDGIFVNLISIRDAKNGLISLGDIEFTEEIDMREINLVDIEPPPLAMGTYPEAICCSLANIAVVIVRRQGLVAAFELDEGELNLIAQECVGHFVIDAVMRYSSEVGGAEIVMLLADDKNPKDGRIVSFCFRSA